MKTYRYMIADGDKASNFTIDSNSGEIKPNGVLDYETVASSQQAKSFNLTIRAFDLGIKLIH